MKTATGQESGGGCRLVRVKHLLPSDHSFSSGRMNVNHPAGITVRKSAAAQRNRVWICQSQSDIWHDSSSSADDGTVHQVNPLICIFHPQSRHSSAIYSAPPATPIKKIFLKNWIQFMDLFATFTPIAAVNFAGIAN